MNSNKNNHSKQTSASSNVQTSSPIIDDSENSVKTGSLTPDDLDFWDMYPPEETVSPEPSPERPQEAVENDPATDGKHTLIQYANGEEEWVLISPYLPKNEYDFTKLVCQSNLYLGRPSSHLFQVLLFALWKNPNYPLPS